MAEAVALVPVAGHPGPGVLGYLAVHEQGPLERVQQVEDRAAGACRPRRSARTPGSPGWSRATRPASCMPRSLRLSATTTAVPAAACRRHRVQQWRAAVLPVTRLSPHFAQRADHGRRAGREVLAAQVRGPPVQQQHVLHRQRQQLPVAEAATVSGARAAPCAASASSLPFPGPPGQLAEDGQGQGAVPAQQQLPGPGRGRPDRAGPDAVDSWALRASSNHRLDRPMCQPRQ